MPAKFEFSLQPLLDWRRRLEEEKQREFFTAHRLLAGCDRELDRLADAYARCAKRLTASASSARGVELNLGDAFLRAVRTAMTREASRRADLESACTRARDALVAAGRERGVIEKLMERRRREAEAAHARRAELELDEANARRHERALREGLVRRRAESVRS